MNRWVGPVLCSLLAMPVHGSDKKLTDAENLGFAGPVKSVSTTFQTFMPEPIQPSGYSVIYALSCEQCDFDTHGTEVRSKTGGSLVRKSLDAEGRVQEEITENEEGEATYRTLYTNGLAGKLEQDTYLDGKLVHNSTFRYDSQGNMVEWNVHKPGGTLESHSWSTFDGRGNELESVSDGPGDTYFDIVQTYNPQTGHLESFTSLNRDGSVHLYFRMNDDTVLSYWQQPGNHRNSHGNDVCFENDDRTERNCRDYNLDGTYTMVRYVFTDKSKRNPLKATLYGTDHQVVMAAYYDYELDTCGNWTRRTVRIQTGESGERRLLEKDARTLTYYPSDGTRP